jgi:hypothetical protein
MHTWYAHACQRISPADHSSGQNDKWQLTPWGLLTLYRLNLSDLASKTQVFGLDLYSPICCVILGTEISSVALLGLDSYGLRIRILGL